jgi:putative acetyltransferase
MIVRKVIPTDHEVVALIDKLNQFQIDLYGLEACNLESPESLHASAYMVGAFSSENILAGIGAVKLVSGYAEIKRMYVEENYRGQAIAHKVLTTLEDHARDNGVKTIYLETGNLHYAAIQFYKSMGYVEVERFGNYKPNSVSIYFSKLLVSK